MNVNGKDVKWGDFKRRVRRESEKNPGNKTFILNKGDPEKEKVLHYHMDLGFYSDNSEDMTTKLRRYERQMIEERK